MPRTSSRSVILLALCIMLPLVIGAIGSFFTLPNVTGWYGTLIKPWFTPPAWMFGPVWTILYILMGISLWMVIRNGFEGVNVRTGVIFFGIQLLVNLLWSVIFFGFRSPAGGLITILVLLVLIVQTFLVFRKISNPAAYLLIPYLCWTGFATILTAAVVILN